MRSIKCVGVRSKTAPRGNRSFMVTKKEKRRGLTIGSCPRIGLELPRELLGILIKIMEIVEEVAWSKVFRVCKVKWNLCRDDGTTPEATRIQW